MKRLTFDFETRSRVELKKTGGYKYSLDPSTQPTCLAIKEWDNPNIIFFDFYKINEKWIEHNSQFKLYWLRLIDMGYEFSAHNLFFDRCIYENILVKRYGWPKIPENQYRCTAAKAAACALPRSLEKAGEALKLIHQKDKWGYVAMMAICKPNKKTGKFLEPQDNPKLWQTLYEYCGKDVLSQETLDKVLPDLIPKELDIWRLNQKINWRGLKVDVENIEKILSIIENESEKKLKELDLITMGLVTRPGARQSIMDFLELEGVKLPNLQKKTVEDRLQDFDLSDDMRTVLELRQALSLTSTKKYNSFLDRVNEDGKVRDILMYHGASTGRDTGTGVQPHNFPRGLISVSKERPYHAIENIEQCDKETLKLLYGENLGILFSSVLRNMIIPSEGCELFVADFAKIEVAVLWWLAGNEKGLEILRSGKDPYKYMAAANTGKKYEEILDEGDERQLGKAQVLGSGFGMGAVKFQLTAWQMYRLKLTEEQSKAAINSYREANPEVPKLWKDYENCAIQILVESATQIHFRKCIFTFYKNFLWITLPSGRKLAYREPQIAWRENDYGTHKTLEFMAVNSKTKKWGLERTWGGTLTENIVQGVARDIMMEACLRLEDAGYRVLLTVHDEIICERPIGEKFLKEFLKIMCEVPPWAKGCPIDAKGWTGPRYRK